MFEQIHARLLTIGTRSGSLDAALDRLSANFFDDAILQIDAAIDNIESGFGPPSSPLLWGPRSSRSCCRSSVSWDR